MQQWAEMGFTYFNASLYLNRGVFRKLSNICNGAFSAKIINSSKKAPKDL